MKPSILKNDLARMLAPGETVEAFSPIPELYEIPDRWCSKPRSPHWPAFRHAFIIAHPECSACGTRNALEVHHVDPISWGGEELPNPPEANCMTLCAACHLLIGHLHDWKSKNAWARLDATTWRDKIRARPELAKTSRLRQQEGV